MKSEDGIEIAALELPECQRQASASQDGSLSKSKEVETKGLTQAVVRYRSIGDPEREGSLRNVRLFIYRGSWHVAT
jgi:hypothetical protein